MKKLLIIVLIVPMLLTAQSEKVHWPDDWMVGYKVQIAPLVLVYMSGAAKGQNDVINYHYYQFKRNHPNANDQYWNPDISWTNKYKNNDPAQGPAFWKSTTLLVPLTDAQHMTNGLSKYCMIAALTLKIGEKKRPLKFYLMDALLYTVAYNAGFWTTYEIIYHKDKGEP